MLVSRLFIPAYVWLLEKIFLLNPKDGKEKKEAWENSIETFQAAVDDCAIVINVFFAFFLVREWCFEMVIGWKNHETGKKEILYVFG